MNKLIIKDVFILFFSIFIAFFLFTSIFSLMKNAGESSGEFPNLIRKNNSLSFFLYSTNLFFEEPLNDEEFYSVCSGCDCIRIDGPGTSTCSTDDECGTTCEDGSCCINNYCGRPAKCCEILGIDICSRSCSSLPKTCGPFDECASDAYCATCVGSDLECDSYQEQCCGHRCISNQLKCCVDDDGFGWGIGQNTFCCKDGPLGSCFLDEECCHDLGCYNPSNQTCCPQPIGVTYPGSSRVCCDPVFNRIGSCSSGGSCCGDRCCYGDNICHKKSATTGICCPSDEDFVESLNSCCDPSKIVKINGQTYCGDVCDYSVCSDGLCVVVSGVYDCLGVCDGDAVVDVCGVCDGGITNPDLCDCPSGVYDVCGVCDGDGTSCLDCAGVPFGSAVVDVCGVCDGGVTDPNDCGDVFVYSACSADGLCVVVSGVGVDSCFSDLDCVIPPVSTYRVCNYLSNTCIVVSGVGENKCTVDADCGPVFPPRPDNEFNSIIDFVVSRGEGGFNVFVKTLVDDVGDLTIDGKTFKNLIVTKEGTTHFIRDQDINKNLTFNKTFTFKFKIKTPCIICEAREDIFVSGEKSDVVVNDFNIIFVILTLLTIIIIIKKEKN